MEKFEKMKHYLRNVCVEHKETFEEVKEYIDYVMNQQNYVYDLTDNQYLDRYLQDEVHCALIDGRLFDLKCFSQIYYELYNDEY